MGVQQTVVTVFSFIS